MDDRKDRPDPAPDAAQQGQDLQQRGPAGDARPNSGPDAPDPRTRGGQPQEDVDDRGNVGQVSPDDYPADQRRDSRPDS